MSRRPTLDGSPRRVAVAREPLIGDESYDYADAFEIRAAEPDPRTAEELARAAFAKASPLARLGVLFGWRVLLRFRTAPASSPDHIFGARIVRSEPEVVELEASGPLMRGVIVARKVEPTRFVVTTFVYFGRPRIARAVWAVTAPLHRAIAPRLLANAAR